MLFKKQPKIGREAMFQSKPVRNNQVEWEKNDDGEIHVTLTRGDSWKVRTLSKIFGSPNKKHWCSTKLAHRSGICAMGAQPSKPSSDA